jgi:hypothetical protein
MRRCGDGPEKAIKSIFARRYRERFLRILAESDAGRTGMLVELAHIEGFDPRFARRIPPREQTEGAIHAILRERGAADTCHVVSADAMMDGRDMPLHDALVSTVGANAGSILSCIPGQLAYYEGEEHGQRYILERRGG